MKKMMTAAILALSLLSSSICAAEESTFNNNEQSNFKIDTEESTFKPKENEYKTIKTNGLTYKITSSATQTTPGKVTLMPNVSFSGNLLNVPDMITYQDKNYYVTEIEPNAFIENRTINKITIGKNVESIGNYAFALCSALSEIIVDANNKNYSSSNGMLFNKNKTSLICCPQNKSIESYTVPSSLKEIYDGAFMGNEKLYSFSFASGSNLERIGEGAFTECTALKKVNFPISLTEIGNYAFANTAVEDIVLPSKLETLGKYAFTKTPLYSIKISSSVSSIPEGAFCDCFSLKSITLNDNCSEIGQYAFRNVPIRTITVPEKVKSIGYGAFMDCNLESVKLGSALETINSQAFYNCTRLTNITIPLRVRYIGEDVFTGCVNMKSIAVSGSNDYFEDRGGVLFDKGGSKLIFYPPARLDTSYEISQDVKEIYNNAISYCTNLNEFTVEDSNRNFSVIDGVLFDYNQEELVQYPIGKIVSNYDLPEYTRRIRSRAFAGANISGNFNIDKYLEQIGDSVFENCARISEFNVSEINSSFVSKDGVLFSKDMTQLYSYPDSKKLSSYSIPLGVSVIKNGAFMGCELNDVVIPETVIAIEREAFMNSQIKTVSLPESLVEICEDAFRNSNLEAVTFPSSLTSLGNTAFADCSSLRRVEFTSQKPMSEIGNNIFANTNITKIYYPAGIYNIYKAALIDMGSDIRLLASSDTASEKEEEALEEETVVRKTTTIKMK